MTILRPAAFMQNMLTDIGQIKESHIFAQRFYTGPDAPNRINLIDADDYGEIAALVTTDDAYAYAQLDLCGPRNLSARDMLDALSAAVGADITLRYISDDDFIRTAESRGMPRHTLDVLLTMFRSYNDYGFPGNPCVSGLVLGRPLNDFVSFVSEAMV